MGNILNVCLHISVTHRIAIVLERSGTVFAKAAGVTTSAKPQHVSSQDQGGAVSRAMTCAIKLYLVKGLYLRGNWRNVLAR